ncbi:hypothetical protein ACJMK2_024675 [Sinanodonta woodiana]|uniref:Uncharacterized protein n=1 Tax=Sinanodonta woodiana TaxID=1069815 RepID=A0ABD3XE30_SINWO
MEMGPLLTPVLFLMAALSTMNCITAQSASQDMATASSHKATPVSVAPRQESQNEAATTRMAGTPSNMATAAPLLTRTMESTRSPPVVSTKQTTKPPTGVLKQPSTCCYSENMVMMLQKNRPVVNGYVPYVSILELANGTDIVACDTKLLLKATFRRNDLADSCQGCTSVPQCGNQMLKIELWMSPNKTGVSFHVGDSITNNGFGGDDSTQENNAEFHMYDYEQRLYGSDKCSNMSQLLFSLPSTVAHWVTVYIGNEFIRVSTPLGDTYELCSDCLFALNGQTDSKGTVNEDIYIGLNRIIPTQIGDGSGVCGAVISWACPWKA